MVFLKVQIALGGKIGEKKHDPLKTHKSCTSIQVGFTRSRCYLGFFFTKLDTLNTNNGGVFSTQRPDLATIN